MEKTSLETENRSTRQEISPSWMETEGSLPCSVESTTEPLSWASWVYSGTSYLAYFSSDSHVKCQLYSDQCLSASNNRTLVHDGWL